VTGRALEHGGWVADGLAALDFLLETTTSGGTFDFVGNEGWLRRGGTAAAFGQQPIEAGYTAQACMVAYEVTGDESYLGHARSAVEWLLGRNRLGVALYDPGRAGAPTASTGTGRATTSAPSRSSARCSGSWPCRRPAGCRARRT
jgi:hypothetical protein